MRSPEVSTPFQTEALNYGQNQNPVEGKSFENLQSFVISGTVKPIKVAPGDEKSDYSDRRIYYTLPKNKTTFQNQDRDLGMLYTYLFEEKTLEDIGKENGNLTREAVRQIIEARVKDLHNGAEEWARDQFPLESFDFRKPFTLTSRQKFSEIQGGRSNNIAKRLAEGATLDDLKKEFGQGQIARSRVALKNRGIDIEREKNPVLPRFEGLGNPEATNDEIQALLDKIRYPREYLLLKKSGLVVDVTTVTRKAGLHLRSNRIGLISESLAKELLPQTKVAIIIKDKDGKEKTVYYHIIATIHEPIAVDLLQSNRNLDIFRVNPVSQIAGPKEEKLPNTSKLVSEEYGSLGSLIGELIESRWGGMGKGGINTADIIKGSPVEIYYAKRRFFYRNGQEIQLRQHIQSRLRELG